jgi:15-cis-phytoene synthase
MDAEEAYAECERITWEQARNFAYGIRLLPPPKRRALAAVYAYARRVDDIGDGDLPASDKAAALEACRPQVAALVAGSATDESDPVLVALADAGKRFGVPLAAFGELIDGCLADVNEATYETFDDLHHYCRCVAGSIGRLSLGVYQGEREDNGVVPSQAGGRPRGYSVPRFARAPLGRAGSGGSSPLSRGADRGAAPPGIQERMADDLGIALQVTNILRDVREDFGNGRVYLPAEDLAKFGCELVPGQPEPFDDPDWQARFAQLVEFEANRAREWYASGMRLLATIDWRSAACTGAMAGIYRRLLEKIAADPRAVLQGRMSLPGKEKALVAVRALSGVDRRGLGRRGGTH